MKIAVTHESEQIFQHFGYCETFKVYEVENSKALPPQVVGTGRNGYGALVVSLKNLSAEAPICGGIGGGARAVLAQAGTELYLGASGNVDEAVDAPLKGNLVYNPDTTCNRHHEGGEHSCHGRGGSCSH